MIPTHRNKLIGKPISIPVISLGGTIGLSFTVLVILVNTSGCVCLINSTPVVIFMVSISSLPGFGAKFGLQDSDSARNVPDAGIASISSVVNCTL